jgi:signal transduction histidine kinase/ActR/RegA family two-component response regulator
VHAKLLGRGDEDSEDYKEAGEEGGSILLLGDVIEEILSSLDYAVVLERMAIACVPSLADACVVDVLIDGSSERAGAAHAEPESARRLRAAGPVAASDIESFGLAPVIVAADELDGVAGDGAPRKASSAAGRITRSLGARSVLVIPVPVRGRLAALWMLGVTAASGRASQVYSASHIPVGQVLARVAAAALENALLYQETQASREEAMRAADLQAAERVRLFEAEQAAREAAERAAERTARLQNVTVELSGALTPAEVSRIILDGSLEAFGASAGAIGLVTEDGRALEIMQARGKVDEAPQRSALIRIDAPLPVVEAVRSGAPVWLESPASFDARYKEAPPSGGAWAGVPLIVNTRVIGGLALTFPEPRAFDDDDREFVTTLARQCTLALERACLFDAELRARQEIAFLADANLLLSAAADQEVALAQLARFTVPFLADMCAIDILDKDGVLRRVAVAHVDRGLFDAHREAMERPPEDRSQRPCLFSALDSGSPAMIEEGGGASIVKELFGEAAAELAPSIRVRSAMLVPLVFEGRTLGIISLGSARRRFSLGDLAVAEPLGRRAAVAIDRARLLREAEEARREAERATLQIAHLQAMTAAASEALTSKQVADAMIKQALATVGACAGGFGQLTEDGAAIEVMGVTGYATSEVDPARLIPLVARAPIPDVVREGCSIFLEDAEAVIARYPRLAAVHTAHGYGALAIIPLLVEGRTTGGLGLVFPGPRSFTDDDRSFMNALGRHCAQALERARAYEAERRAHVAASEANRLKDEFLATLSHELRTPLTAILGWARMLRTMKSNELVTHRALETIERNATLQSRLIDDLLDASRIITGKLRLEVTDVDLASVIHGAIDAVSHAAHAKEITLRPKLDPSVGPIEGDSSRLQQIVWNLLSNAIKFTPTGGVVEVHLERAGAEAHISVSDSGPGIAAEFLPFVFDRFRQGDSAITRKHGGLGLGLAIVRSLVDMHGGTVHASSDGEGKGARFTVKLPLPGQRKAQSTPAVAHPFVDGAPGLAGLPGLSGLHILVVDDEPDSLEVLIAVLESRGASVTAASSVREALAAFERDRPHVLVSDIAMPEEDGYELIRKVRMLDPARGGRVAAVALTAYARVEDRVRALSAGFQVHVPKPVTPAELIAVVAALGSGVTRHED